MEQLAQVWLNYADAQRRTHSHGILTEGHEDQTANEATASPPPPGDRDKLQPICTNQPFETYEPGGKPLETV